MTVPGRVEAAVLLLSLGPPAWFLHHSRGVADVAAWLAAKASARGLAVDRRLVEAAALLHDVDKLLLGDDPACRLPHGAGSAAWLARRGHGELGPSVASHPVTRLADDGADEWLERASLEERIVAYADKRAGQRLEPMGERFASWRRRYPAGWTEHQAAIATARAERLEAEVCGAAGVGPGDVRRLRWTGPAIHAARRALV
jgi:hypothetical protein